MEQNEEFNWEEVTDNVALEGEKKNPFGNEQQLQLLSQDGLPSSLELGSEAQSTSLNEDGDKIKLKGYPTKEEEQAAVEAGFLPGIVELPPVEIKPKQEDEIGFLEQFGKNVQLGALEFQKMLYETPGMLYRLAAYPLDKITEQFGLDIDIDAGDKAIKNIWRSMGLVPPSEQLQSQIDYLENYLQSKDGLGVVDNIKKGNYAEALQDIFSEVGRSLPTTGAMMVTGGGGAVANVLGWSVPFAAQSYNDLKKLYPNASEDQLISTAWTLGIIESAAERIGTVGQLDELADIAKGMGKDEFEKAAKESIRNELTKYYTKVIPKSDMLEGMVEEGATTLAQNIAEKVLINPDKDVTEGVVESTLVGGAMGSSIGLTKRALKFYNSQLRNRKKSIENQVNLLSSELKRDITPETQEAILDKLDELRFEGDKINDEAKIAQQRYTEEQLNKIADINERLDKNEKLLNQDISEEVKQILIEDNNKLEKELADIDKEAEANVKDDKKDIAKDLGEDETDKQVTEEKPVEQVKEEQPVVEQVDTEDTEEAKEEDEYIDSVIGRLENLKIKADNIVFTGITGLEPVFAKIGIAGWNKAIDLAINEIKSGTNVGAAILRAIRFIDEKMIGISWDKEKASKEIEKIVTSDEIYLNDNDFKDLVLSYWSKNQNDFNGLIKEIRQYDFKDIDKYSDLALLERINNVLKEKEGEVRRPELISSDWDKSLQNVEKTIDELGLDKIGKRFVDENGQEKLIIGRPVRDYVMKDGKPKIRKKENILIIEPDKKLIADEVFNKKNSILFNRINQLVRDKQIKELRKNFDKKEKDWSGYKERFIGAMNLEKLEKKLKGKILDLEQTIELQSENFKEKIKKLKEKKDIDIKVEQFDKKFKLKEQRYELEMRRLIERESMLKKLKEQKDKLNQKYYEAELKRLIEKEKIEEFKDVIKEIDRAINSKYGKETDSEGNESYFILNKTKDGVIKEYVTKEFYDKYSNMKEYLKKSEGSAALLNNKWKNLISSINAPERKGDFYQTRERRLIKFLDFLDELVEESKKIDVLNEVAKLKKGIKSKIHESEYRSKVVRFLTINPKKLTDNELKDYVNALKDINQKVPDYRQMDSIYDKIVKDEELKDLEYDPLELQRRASLIIQKIVNTPLNSVDDYLLMLKEIKNLRRNLSNYLVVADENNRTEIEQMLQQIQDIIDGKSEQFEEELKGIKEDLLFNIKDRYARRDESFLTKEDKKLLNEFEILTDEQLMALNVLDLEMLADSFDRLVDGYFPYNQINKVIQEAQSISASKEIANQIKNQKQEVNTKASKLINKISDYLTQTQKDLVVNMGIQDLAFIEDVLKLKGSAITKYLVAPMTRQLTAMKVSIDNKLARLEKAKPTFLVKSEKSMNRIGMIMLYLRDYHRQAKIKPQDVPTRDWFGELINNETEMALYSTKEQRTIKKIHNELAQKYPNGLGGVDVDALVADFKKDKNLIFDKNELKFYEEIRQILQELLTKQKAVNEALGKPFDEEEYYVPMNRILSGETQDIKTQAFNWDAAKKRADAGKQKISDKIGAVQTNIEYIMRKAILETERDYSIYYVDSYMNKTLNKVRKLVQGNSRDEIMTNALKEEMRLRARFEFTTSALSKYLTNIRTAKMAYSLYDIFRSLVEVGASVVSNPFRTGIGFKGVPKSFKFFTPSNIKLVNNLIEITESSLFLRELQKEFGHEGTTGKKTTIFEKLQSLIISLPEHITFQMIWYPSFVEEFEAITGKKFDKETFNSSENYRDKYLTAIRDAAAVADRNTKKVTGGGLKAESRRLAQFSPMLLTKPIFNKYGVVDINSYQGKLISFLGNYVQRENTVLSDGIKKVFNGQVDEGLSQTLGVILNMTTYSMLSGLYMVYKLIKIEEDEEKADDLLDELLNPENIAKNAAIQIANSFLSRYGAFGRELIFIACQIRYTKAKMEGDKETAVYWEKFMKDNLFKSPIESKEDYYNHLISLETTFGYLITELWDITGKKGGWADVIKKYENNEELTEKEIDILRLINNLITSINIIIAPAYGLVIPGKKAIKSSIRKIEKEEEEEKEKKKKEDRLRQNPYLYNIQDTEREENPYLTKPKELEKEKNPYLR